MSRHPKIQINDLIEITRSAGQATLSYYGTPDLSVFTKEDKSPVTAADRASHDLLMMHLPRLMPNVPIVSEEGDHPKNLPELYWLIDPLDGTREFIKRNDEFSVLVSLMKCGEPVVSVVEVPVAGVTYYAIRDGGAFSIRRGGRPVALKCSPMPKNGTISVCISRSHSDEKSDRFLGRFPHHKVIQRGSALKFGLLAEGAADVYLRLGQTKEWDTAAGQLILEEAGGIMIDLSTKEKVKYGKPDFRNNGFIAIADPSAKEVFLNIVDVC